MSVQKYKLKNGETRYRVQIYFRGSDGKEHIKQKRGFTTLALAKDYEAAQRLKLKEVTDNVTLGAAISSFLDYKDGRVKESTLRDYTYTLVNTITPYFGHDMPLRKIDVQKLVKWQEDILHNDDFSDRYIEKLQTEFSMFWKYVVRHPGINIHRSPFDYVEFVHKEKPLKRIHYYTLEEYKNFRSVIEDPEYLLLFDMLYFTGMRKSELQARLWDDIDWRDCSVHINTNWDRVRKTATLSTKNGGDRVIYLSDLLIKGLKEHRERHPEDKYIFEYNSKPWEEKRIRRSYEAYLKTWNDEHPDEQLERLVIHDFRHCHVTFLINNGIDSMVIAERTGHTKEMVERVYGHLFPSRKKEVLNVLNVEL